MSARSDLRASLDAAESVLRSPAAIDGPPHELARNAEAKLVRAGIAVTSFAAVERFLRARVEEMARHIGNANVQPSAFSDRLRRMATIEAVKSLSKHLEYNRDDPDLILLVQDETAKIGSMSGRGRVEFSRFFAGWRGSNVNSNDVLTLLKAFGVEKPWDEASAFARRAGLSVLTPLQDEFQRAMEDRHEAAHTGVTSASSATLQTRLSFLRAFAFCVDVLLTRATANLVRGAIQAMQPPELHFVQSISDTDHRWFPEAAWSRTPRRAKKRFAEREKCIDEAAGATVAARGVVVVFDSRTTLADWRATDFFPHET